MDKQPTQKDVALRLGISQATVSLALKGSTRISQALKDRVLECSATVGYAVNPTFMSLSSYSRKGKSVELVRRLAWLVVDAPDYDWRENSTYRRYFEGASSTAAKLGYELCVFKNSDFGSNIKATAEAMKAEGAGGILICPQPFSESTLNADWNQFACVSMGYTLAKPSFDTVTDAQFEGVLEVMARLRSRQYKRIGFAISQKMDARADRNYFSAYMLDCHMRGQEVLVASSDELKVECGNFTNWLNRNRVDAVIAGAAIYSKLSLAGIEPPFSVALAAPDIESDTSLVSGYYVPPESLGSVAANILINKIVRGETGVPASPRRTHVNGKWVEGRTA